MDVNLQQIADYITAVGSNYYDLDERNRLRSISFYIGCLRILLQEQVEFQEQQETNNAALNESFVSDLFVD